MEYIYPYRRQGEKHKKSISIECVGCKYFPLDISRSSVYPCCICCRLHKVDYYRLK